MHMRKSKVLKIMREGGVAVSVKLNLADPRAVEIAAMCGYDCIRIDMEHVVKISRNMPLWDISL